MNTLQKASSCRAIKLLKKYLRPTAHHISSFAMLFVFGLTFLLWINHATATHNQTSSKPLWELLAVLPIILGLTLEANSIILSAIPALKSWAIIPSRTYSIRWLTCIAFAIGTIAIYEIEPINGALQTKFPQSKCKYFSIQKELAHHPHLVT